MGLLEPSHWIGLARSPLGPRPEGSMVCCRAGSETPR